MIERRGKRPPVTYTTFQARDLGKDTAELFQQAPASMPMPASSAAGDAGRRILHRRADPGRSRRPRPRRCGLPMPGRSPLELPSAIRSKENWGAAETFYQTGAQDCRRQEGRTPRARKPLAPGPACNILGPTALGFRHRDDVSRNRPACWRQLGDRGQRHRPAGRHARRSGAAGRRRLQHLPVSRNRRANLPLARTPVRPEDRPHRPDRPWRDARLHRRGRGAGGGRSGPGARHLQPAVVEPVGRFDLSYGQARLHLRRS